MGSQVLLQVASTFDASPLGASLGSVLVEAEGVTFVQYTQISEYLLSPAANSAQSLGSLIILRVEDWLREELQSIHRDSFSDSWIRQQLRIRTDEFVSQLTTLSDSGKQVWFFACPSTGWIAEQHKLTTLFRTYTNLIATRVRNLSHVTSLAWPVSLSVGEIDDHLSDRLEHIPFTPSAFDLLGRYAGIQVVRTLIRREDGTTAPVSDGSTALASYLAGLNLKIKLAEALPDDRVHVDRLLRGTASFSLTGERPSIEDSEVSALLDSHTCRLVHVCDRVGDYGASGLVLFHVTEDGMSVSSLALSCTVLGKQVEFAVLSVLAQLAVDNGLTKLVFEYTPTSRNQAILKFLQLIADRESNTRYVVPIDKIESRIKASAINSEAWTIEQSVGQEDGLLLR
jgi:hypothetical protein